MGINKIKLDGTYISRFGYSLDNAGNRTGCLLADGSRVTWTYDDAYQLTRDQRSGPATYDSSYSYDSVGNRTLQIDNGVPTTHLYDAADQLVTSQDPTSTVNWSFDENGNTRTTGDLASPNVTLTWDYEDRMVRADLFGSLVMTTIYDGDDRRLAGSLTAAGSTASGNILWDDQNALAFYNDDGSLQSEYTLEPQLYGNLLSKYSGGAATFYHFDGVGTTTDQTDESAAILGQQAYKAFGELVRTDGADPDIFAYIGQLGYQTNIPFWLAVRRRDYLPIFGRWLSPDQIDNSISDYSYSANSPARLVDPSGLLSQLNQPPMSSCGNVRWTPKWVLGSGERTGFIVQFVTINAEECPCDPSHPGCCSTQGCKQHEWIYSEAWPVWDGVIYQRFRAANQHPRRKTPPPIPNPYDTIYFNRQSRCVTFVFHGQSLFLPLPSGDDMDYLLRKSFKYKNLGAVGFAGQLQSKESHATELGRPTRQSVLNAGWMCCGDNSHWAAESLW